ncbi:MAG TPA: hypothetical protein VK737_06600, partial [Opitutales bacterium]|nr:hypothetical protein [Opitutales bacterium]
MLTRVTANAGPLGGLLRTVIMRFSGAASKNGKKKFPWVSAILAGMATAGFTSWWKHRHDEQ